MPDSLFWNLNDPDLVSAIDELPLWSAPFGRALLDAVQLKPNLKVLDIGSGLGFPSLQLAQSLGKSSQVFALEPWKAAADRIRLKMQQYQITNVTIIDSTVEEMPFEDNYFDLITSNNGLNNVQDLRQAWNECGRIAKPGAQMIFTENLPKTMVEFYESLKAVLSELGLANLIGAVDEHIYSKRKPIEETRQLVARGGFRIVGENYGEFCMRFLDASAMLNSFLIRLAFLPSWRDILPEAERDRVFTLVSTKLDQLAADKGSLTLTIPFVCIDCRKG